MRGYYAIPQASTEQIREYLQYMFATRLVRDGFAWQLMNLRDPVDLALAGGRGYQAVGDMHITRPAMSSTCDRSPRFVADTRLDTSPAIALLAMFVTSKVRRDEHRH
jgi:hypothetical protein